MNRLSSLVASAAVLFPLAATAATVSVDGRSNLFAAGQGAVSAPGGGGGGVLPPSVAFAAGAGKVLTFSSVVGLTDCCSGVPDMDADGSTNLIAAGTTVVGAANGISGITAPRQMFLAGVFLDDSVPAGAAPASLDFTGNTGFASLSPLLNQMFFIGDGLTGTGSGAVQSFLVPTGATRLFLGFADGFAFNGAHGFYDDNAGTLRATFEISDGTTVVPVPAALPLMLAGLGVFGLVARRRG
ncbi:MAG: VPLPA-CTERM sorting domain-containing protein [bacterium]|jgi:hypothetical protein|nr:VPLPA-CTERM sorting domain-containing protein [Betaproteobacteria bacterium]